MTACNGIAEVGCGVSSPPSVKMRILEQMAEALEDQVSALYRRAATFEEEEFLLNREVEERQTEINRLTLKLEAMRAERDRVIDRIESISSEVAAIREEVFSGEEEVALAAIDSSTPGPSIDPAFGDSRPVPFGGDSLQHDGTFFRRMTVAAQA